MSDPKKPAFGYGFPSSDGAFHYEGLTAREYIAAMAMQGLLSNSEWMQQYLGEKYLMQADTVANVAVRYADELLKELSKKEEQK